MEYAENARGTRCSGCAYSGERCDGHAWARTRRVSCVEAETGGWAYGAAGGVRDALCSWSGGFAVVRLRCVCPALYAQFLGAHILISSYLHLEVGSVRVRVRWRVGGGGIEGER